MTHYHVIGVGGAGMSAIAHILLDQGHVVSGCDAQANALTQELTDRGVQIFRGHAADHLDGVDIVATSSALKMDHPELVAARERSIPVQKRADLWREWSQQKPTLAIAGTHGKTTTTAMCALILQELGYDPAYIVPAGGPVPGLDRFAKWGSGPFVIEADEYDRLFLGLLPTVSIITSIDWDHVDIYPTRESVEDAFAQFARQTTKAVVICIDDDGASRLWEQWGTTTHAASMPQWVAYAIEARRGWRAVDIRNDGTGMSFTVTPDAHMDEPAPRGEAKINVPGTHNVQNALGTAIGVYELLDHHVPLTTILAALKAFRGAARRFELKGEANGVTVIDDYAHNPPKVRAALQAARMRYPDRRIVAYFQPHTFSRTQALIDEFAHAFGDADVLLIGDIYPSRERAGDFPGIDAAYLVERITQPRAQASGNVQQSADLIRSIVQPGDVVITLGAGDGNQVGDRVLAGPQAEQPA